MECRLARRNFRHRRTAAKRRKQKPTQVQVTCKRKENTVMQNSVRKNCGLHTGLSGKTKVGAMTMALAVVAVWGVVSASADKPKHKLARNSTLITSIPYEDPAYDSQGNLANGNPPLPGNTLIFEDNGGLCGHRYPVTAPGG